LVELVDAGIDRPEFNQLRADLGDEAGVRSAAGGGELGCATGVLLDDRGNDLHQPAARRDERFRAKGPLDGVVHAMLLQDRFQPFLEGALGARGGEAEVEIELQRTGDDVQRPGAAVNVDRKSTRLNSSHDQTSYAVFRLT